MPGKEFTAYKEHIQTITALIGVFTVVLYVCGYVAERVHWNMLGIIQVPANHIEFLYRGGNVVVSSLVSVLLYPILSLLELNGRTILLFLLIILMLAITFGGRGLRDSSLRRLWRYARLGCLLLLLVLSILEFRNWPDSRKDLLFLPPTADASTSDAAERFFAGYVGLITLWLAFYFLCRLLETVETSSRQDSLRKPEYRSEASTSFMVFNASTWFVTMATASEGETSHVEEPVGIRPFQPSLVNIWIRRAALIIALVLLINLPLVYGSFRFPHAYPVVRVLIAPTAPPELKNSSSSLMQVGDLKNPISLVSELQTRNDALSQYLWTQFEPATQQEINKMSGSLSADMQKKLAEELNRVLQRSDLFEKQRFSQVNLSSETQSLIEKQLEGEDLIRRNRLLLAEAYPEAIAKASHYFGAAGEPMALLFETTGEYVLYRKSAQPVVLRLKKTDVGGFVVYQSKNVTGATLDAEAVKSQPEP